MLFGDAKQFVGGICARAGRRALSFTGRAVVYQLSHEGF